jgi:hypothetical protein
VRSTDHSTARMPVHGVSVGVLETLRTAAAGAIVWFAVVSGSSTVEADVGAGGQYATGISVDVPGFHGSEPRVELSYGSDAGYGLLGVGWWLSAGTLIARVSARHGAPRLDASDVHLLERQWQFPFVTTQPNPPRIDSPGPGHPTPPSHFAGVAVSNPSVTRLAYSERHS